MIRITVSGFGEIETQEGEKLYELLSCRGLTEGPCGGKGRCGKCRVRLLTPCPPEDEEYRFFSKEELEAGWRLACLHTAEDGMAVALP
jgi:Na+-transporting NADH:ubiquinone oxidoreductase subunit NqrF